MYQNLLKELVEAGMSEEQGGQRGAEWLAAAQQRHKSKLHRKIDRKASKGRKTVRLTTRIPGTHAYMCILRTVLLIDTLWQCSGRRGTP